jgi:hypothetical protein
LQSTLPGFAVHLPVQSCVQVVSQSALAVALHLPSHCVSSFAEQASSKLIGVHCALQPPCVSILHCASALTLMLLHALRSARASFANIMSAAPAKEGRIHESLFTVAVVATAAPLGTIRKIPGFALG